MGGIENKKQFQGQEFSQSEFRDGSGLGIYEFKWRMHDPQTGRFWQIDPLSDQYVYNSTYAFSENKVTSHVELEGLEAVLSPRVYGKDAGLESLRGAGEVIFDGLENILGKSIATVKAPWNKIGSDHAAGNA